METMFCINKDNGYVYRIYDITYNKNGYPHFLVFDNGVWVRKSAKHFIPAEMFMDVNEESCDECSCADECERCSDETCGMEILQ